MKTGILIPLILALTSFSSCQKTDTNDMKIMTFNIRYGTATDGENSWEYRKHLLIDCLNKYKPDILGIQEAHDYQVNFIKSAFQNWETFGVGRYHTVAEPDRPQESLKGESCTIFYDTTKFTKIEHGTFWHSDTPNEPASITWGNKYPRITTWGILEQCNNGKRFFVMNTHFSGEEPYVSNTANLNMLKKREIAGSMPTIFMGDFNLSPESDAHELFCNKIGAPEIRGNFIDCWQALHKPEQDAGTGHSFTGSKSNTRIDWILMTPDFAVSNIDIIYYKKNGRYPSDHYPVFAELKFK